jgi:hypothetical protein
MANDLSAYELARLERIKRNESRLRDLGLIRDRPEIKRPVVDDAPKKVVAKRKQKLSVATRSSKRLQGLTKDENISHLEDEVLEVEDNFANEDVVVEGEVNYATMPQKPEELDDNEFQIYAKLRAWRLRRKNELEVEPYKICQNRTLCELIRRRRNNSAFASLLVGETGNNVEQDLLSVWGIGPSKATQGGFGWEMIEILDLDENCQLLELSRGCSANGEVTISPQLKLKGTRLISPSTMIKAIMMVAFAALHSATAFTPNSNVRWAHISTTSLQCICIHCARVTNCSAYHFVEEQHTQPHINKSPTWEPRNGSPTIQVHIRPDVNGKIQQELGQMWNEHNNETRRAEEALSNSQGGEEDVPLFGEKQYDLRGTTSYEYDVVECEDFVLSKDNWVLNMPEEIRIANPNFVPT